MGTLTPSHLSLIDALAEEAAADYLRELASTGAAEADQRPNPAPLPAFDQAA